IGQAQDQKLRSLDGLGVLIQRRSGLLNDEIGHLHIYFARKLNELGAEVVFFRFPRKVERIDRDAVTAEAGSWIERLETEWLCFRRIDYLVNIDAHSHAKLLQFVYQRDVDAAVDVLKELRHLGCSRAADSNDSPEDRAV